MKAFTKHYFISSSIDKVWKALTDTASIKEWLGEEVTFNCYQGGDFSLWKDTIKGRNLEIVPNKQLVQEWFGGKWEQPSLVTFTLNQIDLEHVEIILKHENLPDNEVDNISSGWDEFYMNPIKVWCERKE